MNKKILIARLDRIGDVVLSTPVIKALRDAYPDSHIAMMVRPCAREIVEGNPYLDEVIIYDKDRLHKGIANNYKIIQELGQFVKNSTGLKNLKLTFCTFLEIVN